MRNAGLFWLILYLAFALYFVNSAFSFVPMPQFFLDSLDKWFTLIGGILILIGGINHYRIGRYRGIY